MKIYYAGSIWGAQGDESFNRRMISHLKINYGEVLSEHLFLPDYKSGEHLDMKQIHDRDLRWVNQADWVVAEVSAPSLGVGYELREAVLKNKPVLALFRQQEKRLSAMIDGSPGVVVYNYTDFDNAVLGVEDFAAKNNFAKLNIRNL